MGSFIGYRQALLRAPIAGPNGRAWAAALGAAQDDELPLLRIAGVCRSTLKAPDDALAPVLGSVYARAQAPRELLTPDRYRARLGGAWPFWEQAPLSSGISSLFAVYDTPPQVPQPAIVVTGSVATGLPQWAEFVIVWPSALLPDTTWDDDPADLWDDGGLWEIFYDPADPTTAPSFGVKDLSWFRREIRLCKGAPGYPVVVAVGLFGGALKLLAGGSLWDDGSLWDADTLAAWDSGDAPYTYLPLGHVWEEEDLIYGGGAPSGWDAEPGIWDQDGDAFAPPEGGW